MSLSAAVIDALVASGVTVEQLAAAVKADAAADEQRRATKRANNAERQRRFKAKHKDEVTKDNADNALPTVTPLEVSPHTPLPKTPESSPPISPRKKRGLDMPEVPDWVPAEPWAAFDEMRRSMKHKWPWTPAAAKGIWDDLAGFRAGGHDIGALLMNSVKKGYRGVFAPDRPPPAKPTPPPELTADNHEFLAKYQADRDPVKAEHHRQEAARLRKSASIGSLIPEIRVNQ